MNKTENIGLGYPYSKPGINIGSSTVQIYVVATESNDYCSILFCMCKCRSESEMMENTPLSEHNRSILLLFYTSSLTVTVNVPIINA